jgi:hypothetical protein
MMIGKVGLVVKILFSVGLVHLLSGVQHQNRSCLSLHEI